MDLLFRLVTIFCITAGIFSGVLAVASAIAFLIDEGVADRLLDSSIVSLKCAWLGIIVYCVASIVFTGISNVF